MKKSKRPTKRKLGRFCLGKVSYFKLHGKTARNVVMRPGLGVALWVSAKNQVIDVVADHCLSHFAWLEKFAAAFLKQHKGKSRGELVELFMQTMNYCRVVGLPFDPDTGTKAWIGIDVVGSQSRADEIIKILRREAKQLFGHGAPDIAVNLVAPPVSPVSKASSKQSARMEWETLSDEDKRELIRTHLEAPLAGMSVAPEHPSLVWNPKQAGRQWGAARRAAQKSVPSVPLVVLSRRGRIVQEGKVQLRGLTQLGEIENAVERKLGRKVIAVISGRNREALVEAYGIPVRSSAFYVVLAS